MFISLFLCPCGNETGNPNSSAGSSSSSGSGGDTSSSNDDLLPTLDTSPTLTLDSIKQFRFTWSEGEIPVTHYRLLEKTDSDFDFTNVSGDIPAGTKHFTLEVPLHERVNTQYILR